MITASRSHTKLIQHCTKYLYAEYSHVYGNHYPEYAEVISTVSTLVLEKLIGCDAPYHNLEHTVQVVLAGQEILAGKYLCDESISPQEWLHFLVALLCHDIGYLKGVCSNDQPEQHCFVTGIGDERVTLPSSATGASLTPYHVDRGKLFVAENFSAMPLIDVQAVQLNIELTRFPVPKETLHQDTLDFPGLARAADLIGQLADPVYLAKLPALFREFEEIGSNKALGYTSPKDLRAGYPRFYWQGVSLYLKHGIRYLEMSKTGRAILANLYSNRAAVEEELDRFYHGPDHFIRGLFRKLNPARLSSFFEV